MLFRSHKSASATASSTVSVTQRPVWRLFVSMGGTPAAALDLTIPCALVIGAEGNGVSQSMIEGNHKKQSGGHGQYGNVKMNYEPIEGDEFVFAEEIFGGSVPKNFFPAVEKGLREAVNKGVLAGYPLVGLKATLYDGSYHPVDSNEMAFKTAAQLAYKEGIPNAKPTILEPIGNLKVTIPDANLGDIMDTSGSAEEW